MSSLVADKIGVGIGGGCEARSKLLQGSAEGLGVGGWGLGVGGWELGAGG
jgi:hypothetical protein